MENILATITQAGSSSTHTEGGKKTFSRNTPLSVRGEARGCQISLQTVLETFHPEGEKHNDEMVFSLVHRRFKFLNRTGQGRVVKKKYIQNCQVCKARKIP